MSDCSPVISALAAESVLQSLAKSEVKSEVNSNSSSTGNSITTGSATVKSCGTNSAKAGSANSTKSRFASSTKAKSSNTTSPASGCSVSSSSATSCCSIDFVKGGVVLVNWVTLWTSSTLGTSSTKVSACRFTASKLPVGSRSMFVISTVTAGLRSAVTTRAPPLGNSLL